MASGCSRRTRASLAQLRQQRPDSGPGLLAADELFRAAQDVVDSTADFCVPRGIDLRLGGRGWLVQRQQQLVSQLGPLLTLKRLGRLEDPSDVG